MTRHAGDPAVVLLSGGTDSATALAAAAHGGYTLHALSFRYGQRHDIELHAARRVATAAGVASHTTVPVSPSVFAASPLTGTGPIPHGRDPRTGGIAPTYVPGRNTVFLACALARAEALGARDIFIGVNADDHEGYPDCRPAYLAAFEEMASLATPGGDMRIRAPFASWTKAQIIAYGLGLGVDYSLTWSCYDPDTDRPCGTCDACQLRAAAFRDAGAPDPLVDP